MGYRSQRRELQRQTYDMLLLINKKLNILLRMEDHMGQEMDDLKREVAETQGITESAIALINGIREQLAAAIANNDVEGLKKLAADLDASQAALAAAVAGPQPAPEPGPAPEPQPEG